MDVNTAQEELNRVTDEYSAKLAPLTAQTAAIREQKQAIQDKQRAEKDQKVIDDDKATADEKELARLDLLDIANRQQIHGVELERDAAVGAAKAKVEAATKVQAQAQAQVDSQKALLDAQNKQNALIGEQVQALAAAAKAMGGHAAAAKAGVAPQNELADSVKTVSDTIKDIEGTLSTAKERLGGFKTSVSDATRPVMEFGQQIGKAFATGNFTPVMATLKTLGEKVGSWITDAIPLVLQGITDYREKLFGKISDMLPGLLEGLLKFVTAMGGWVLDALPGLLDNIGTFAKDMIDQTIRYVPQWITALAKFAVELISWIGESLPGLVDNLAKFLNGMINWVVDSLPKWGTELAKLGGQIIQWVLDALPGLGTNLGKALGLLLSWIVQTAVDVIPKLLVLAFKFLSRVATDVLPALPGVLLTIATALYNFIAGVVGEVGPKLIEVAKKFYGWITTDVLPYLPGEIEKIKTAIGDWILTAISWLGGEAAKIGTGLVDGIKQGISDQWAAFMSWIRDKIHELPQPVRDALGISSPSKVFAEIGQFLIEGLIAGISAMMPKVKMELVEGFAKSVSDMIGAIGKAFDILKDLTGWAPPSLQDLFDLLDMIGVLLARFVVVAREANWRQSLRDLAENLGNGILLLFDALSSAIEVGKGLKDQTAISADQIDVMAENFNKIFTAFLDLSEQWDNWSIAAEGDVLEAGARILNAISGSADVFAEMKNLSAIGDGQIVIFVSNIRMLITRMIAVTADFKANAVRGAADFADSAGQIISMIGGAVENFTALQTFAGVGLTQMDLFAKAIRDLLYQFSLIVTKFTQDWMDSAVLFATAAGQIIGIIGGAVEGFSALQGFTGVGVPAIEAFAAAIINIVSYMTILSRWFNEKATEAAAVFAEAAGRITGIIGTAVEGFTALQTFSGVSVKALDAFAAAIINVVAYITIISRWFDANGVAAAATFADGVGRVTTMLKDAVEGLAALATVTTVPVAAIESFSRAIDQLVRAIVAIAIHFAASGLEAAGLFADAAGKAVGILADGVAGFGALATFIAPSQTAIADFATGIQQLVARIIVLAGQFTTTGLTAASAFSTAAKDVIGLLKDGVEGLLALASFSGQVPQVAMDDFITAIRLLVQKIAAVAISITGPALTAASAFAGAAKDVLSLLKDGAEGLAAIKGLTAADPKDIDSFMAGVQMLVNKILAMAALLDAVTLARAIAFAAMAKQVVDAVKAGATAFADLGKFGDGTAGVDSVMTKFSAALHQLIADLIAWVPPQTQALGLAIVQGVATGITANAALIKAAYWQR